MRSLFRLFSVLLLVGALALAYGPDVGGEKPLTDRDAADVSGDIGTTPHDHGPGDSGDAHHHCNAAFCISVFMIHGGYHGLPISVTAVEALASVEDSHNGSATLDNDPPVPRLSA